MAYWGEAMAWNYSIWGEQDREAALAVLGLLGATPAERAEKAPTEREKLYLAAVAALYGEGEKAARDAAYSQAMGDLSARFPDDLEARAFYSLSLLGLTSDARNTENYMRAAAVAEEVFEKNRKHPGALHYLIHAYDDPVHAPLGLRAARLYGTVARSAAHAQHMPSHIFYALGMWDEANAANTASMATARANGPGGYHPLHWLVHSYLQQGNEAEAAKLIAVIEDDARQAATPDPQTRTHLAMCRATWLVEADNPGPAAMMEPVDTTGITWIGGFAGHDLAIGLEYLRRKEGAKAGEALTRLRGRIEAGKAVRAGGSDVASRYTAVSDVVIEGAAVMEQILDASIRFAAGDRDDALKLILAAGEAEDRLVFEYGPPAVVKPAWEVAGEMYLAMGKKAEAAGAFRRVLARYPNRRLSNDGLRKAMNLK
jgi:tetratricopeptide (TPR) repeat protein